MFGQCMAVVAKGNQSLFKAWPKHFFFFNLNKQHSQCYFCECQRAELQNMQYSTVTDWTPICTFPAPRWEEIPTMLSADGEEPPETTGFFCLGSHAISFSTSQNYYCSSWAQHSVCHLLFNQNQTRAAYFSTLWTHLPKALLVFQLGRLTCTAALGKAI